MGKTAAGGRSVLLPLCSLFILPLTDRVAGLVAVRAGPEWHGVGGGVVKREVKRQPGELPLDLMPVRSALEKVLGDECPRLTPQKIWKWCRSGVNGSRLRVVRIGVGLWSSPEWVREWIREQSADLVCL